MWYIVAAVLLLALAGAGFWWWRRRQAASNHRLLSIVVLLKGQKYLDTAIVAAAARRAWGADLGDGENEGADGFVVGAGISYMVMCRGRMAMVNNFPTPYVPDPDKAAAGIVDGRLSRLLAAHQTWFSCDALGVDQDTPDDEVQDWYRYLGKLCAELIDDNCLAIFLPDCDQMFEYDTNTAARLRAGDVRAALDDGRQSPVINIPDSDPRMVAAVAEARRRWPEFVAAFETRAGKNFSAKIPITRQGNTEFIWLEVTAMEHDIVYGTLGNEPMNLPGLKLGSRVKAKLEKLNDWCYVGPAGELVGGFTVKVLEEVAKGSKRKQRSRG
jgi:uncharacterized protein YegJ (DUF2314 family)